MGSLHSHSVMSLLVASVTDLMMNDRWITDLPNVVSGFITNLPTCKIYYCVFECRSSHLPKRIFVCTWEPCSDIKKAKKKRFTQICTELELDFISLYHKMIPAPITCLPVWASIQVQVRQLVTLDLPEKTNIAVIVFGSYSSSRCVLQTTTLSWLEAWRTWGKPTHSSSTTTPTSHSALQHCVAESKKKKTTKKLFE